jgi:Protein of unknown function (DUF3631)
MNWKALLAIADLAGGGWSKQARAAALELRKKDSGQSDGYKALAVLWDLLRDREDVTSAEINAAVLADPASEWCNFRGKGPISQAQFAALLHPYDIYTVLLHPTKRAALSRNGYRRVQFLNAWARVLQIPTKDLNIRTLNPQLKTSEPSKGKSRQGRKGKPRRGRKE